MQPEKPQIVSPPDNSLPPVQADQPTQAQPLSSTAPEATPISYLDQIGSKTQIHTSLFQNKLALAGFVLIIAIIISIALSVIPKSTNPYALLAARLVATQSVADDATSKLKSTKLRAINSNLKIYLTNTIRDLTPFLVKQKIEIKKLDKAILAKESTAELMKRLEDARLNTIYDRTYAREMAFTLSNVITTYNSISRSASSASLKEFISTAKANLEPTQQQFADYNADNS